MSKSAKSSEHEEGDENILLDEGFSVVDDINTGSESIEGGQEKPNDGKKEAVCSKKTEDINDQISESNKEIEKERNKTTTKENMVATGETNKSCSDGSTLILSNDVELGTETPVPDVSKIKVEKVTEDTQSAVTNEKETKQKTTEERDANTMATKAPIKKKGTSSSYVWVTNISNSVNASSLKKHFSDCGKVSTAKVVTNGKLFFGYVEFETTKIAQKCVEKMNNTVLGGRKILLSRSRPDVTKKSTNGQKKSPRNDPINDKQNDEKKGVQVEAHADSRKGSDDKKETEKSSDKIKNEEKKMGDEKISTDDNNKLGDNDKKKKLEEKQIDKKNRVRKEEPTKGDDLKLRMNETKKKLDSLRTDLERTQIEVRNLRRRLTTEQKKVKAEELRAERYRQQMRKLTDEIKEAKLEFKRDVHRLTKKHKMEMEKAEFDRESLFKREEDLRRRQEDLSRDFKKLEDAKKSLEHLKRARKSRSISPPHKRFRGREAVYPDVSPPPPPKLSGDLRKPLLDRPPSSYYEEKKSRGVYERLGDYTDKSFSKDSTNGRYRSSHPVDIAVSKSSWMQPPAEPWKKTSNPPNSTFMKPYMERYGSDGYSVQPSSYYPPGTSDYPKHFDSSRKY
ncbi:SAFB-like transcription modulator isoform X2 [Harmonia axyridis]|uniref:SAFB-like transcription modulator isoform X2 n=1 Tax=Harmonia axyridis TaxID=115357 RepID=UPI001E276F08|nr:SAFB-like transcription modulator isoform X2 [Harmonia axyridis]